jgi:HEAT repeat protein
MPADINKLIEQIGASDSVERGRAADELGRSGDPRALAGLAGLLDDQDVIVRFKAACALAWLGDDSGVDALLWALGRIEFCFAALEALTELGAPSSHEALKRFFRRWHLHPLERLQAAAALHSCGDEQGTEYLTACLDSQKAEERGLALELWGRLRMPSALDVLQGVLSNPDDTHHLDAARGLAHLGDARSLPLLERLTRQREDPLLAEVAASAADTVRQVNQGTES